MKVSLIICTYQRPDSIKRLMTSLQAQTHYPREILIVDGSTDDRTQIFFKKNTFKNLKYYRVSKEDRGLTKQRNYGITRISKEIDIVSFLDDDVVLSTGYFDAIIQAFDLEDDAIGVGGQATNENRWERLERPLESAYDRYCFDGFSVKESSRNKLRNLLGLGSDQLPAVMPGYGHPKTFGYPFTGKNYPIDLLMGYAMNFKKELFDHIQFSTYFEGYSLYEDADFCLRALDYGKIYLATQARLEHLHEPGGRPNMYKYGVMVVRNGWYVWKIKNPSPTLKETIKWHLITLLLITIRATNIITGPNRVHAFWEVVGRKLGWFSLIFKTPTTA